MVSPQDWLDVLAGHPLALIPIAAGIIAAYCGAYVIANVARRWRSR